jgi:hypothetical protein
MLESTGVVGVTGGLAVVIRRLRLLGLLAGVAAARVVRHLLRRSLLRQLIRLFSLHGERGYR